MLNEFFISGLIILGTITGSFNSYHETAPTVPVDYRNFRSVSAYGRELDFNSIDEKKINEVIFHLTNEIRVKHNRKPLEYSSDLERLASMHATDMVKGNFFSHINNLDPRKQTPEDRAKLCNISNPYISENLIEGYGLRYILYQPVYIRGKGKFSETPEGELIRAHTYLSFGEEMLKRWMDSDKHRANILSKDALQLGCGSASFIQSGFNDMPSFYVVQNFQCFEPVQKLKQ